jgi:CubicO group peptidase (beta-lactamase class C family)
MRRPGTTALISILFLAGAIPATAQAPPAPELKALIERLDGRASAELAKDKVGSVTVGVVSGSHLVWTKSYGLADVEKKIPATADTVYRIGSITKQFTALMLLQLVQEGKVHLSDPVEKYFPEVNKIQGRLPNAPPITLVQLATHTSGLEAEPENLEKYLEGPVSEWEKVLIAALPQTRYADEPGTLFAYSNVGYAILGAALSRAAGQPYTEYVKQRIFLPLGMKDSFFEPDDKIRSRISRGYINEEGKLDTETAEREHQGRGYKVPNGAIYSTVGDMAKFVAFEMGEDVPQVLKKETLEESFERLVTVNPGFKRGYGIGFQVLRLGDVILYGHSGGLAGYQAEAYFNRGSRIGVIILRNGIGGSFSTNALLRAAFEAPPAGSSPK